MLKPVSSEDRPSKIKRPRQMSHGQIAKPVTAAVGRARSFYEIMAIKRTTRRWFSQQLSPTQSHRVPQSAEDRCSLDHGTLAMPATLHSNASIYNLMWVETYQYCIKAIITWSKDS
ncbi:hypothetical protein J6590_037816 [Homalodisca vitripennis]|nr:hypothetical protein J6590_037816 [Homalodisca vitripennis]